MHHNTLVCERETCSWEGENYLWRVENWQKGEAREVRELVIRNHSACEIAVQMGWKTKNECAWIEKMTWQVTNDNEVLVREKVSEATGAGQVNLGSWLPGEERKLEIELKGQEEMAENEQGEKWEFDVGIEVEWRNCSGEIGNIATGGKIRDVSAEEKSSISPSLISERLELASREGYSLEASSGTAVVTTQLTKENTQYTQTISDLNYQRLPGEWGCWLMALGLLILVKLCPPKTRGWRNRQ